MATRVTDGMSRGLAAHARVQLPLLNLKKKRDCSQSNFGLVCYTAVFSVVTQCSCGEERCVTILKTAV